MSLTPHLDVVTSANEHHKLVEQIRDALAAAQKAGETTQPLAILDADQFEESWLAHITELPSGARVGVLTPGKAAQFLKERGITVVVGDAEGEQKRTYDVDVFITGSATITVEATCEEEAREMVEDQMLDDPHYVETDVDITVIERTAKRARGAA